ncbi:MAG TPA: universal stress protein [Actinomycetota bacterium]
MRILYATDGSEASIAAAAVLEKVARRGPTSVAVLSVVRDVPSPHPEDRSAADAIVAATVARLRDAGFAAEGAVVEGEPAPTIVDAAIAHDVVAIGAGSKGWLDRVLLGSVSSAVLHAAERSVLVVHRAPGAADRSPVVVGTDGSPDAAFALDVLTDLLDPAACELQVLSVAHMPTPTVGAGLGIGAAAVYTPELEEALREGAERHAAEAAATLRDRGFNVRDEVVMGSAGLQLLERSRDVGADLVVVGSRGHGAVERAVLGSVSDTVARHAPAALVARPPR